MIYYTNHAKKRMRERGISREQVENCLENYQIIHPDPKGKIKYIYSYPDGSKVKVVVKEKSANHLVIITVED